MDINNRHYPADERVIVYDILEEYRSEIAANEFDLNLQSLSEVGVLEQGEPGFVVVDEAQSCSGKALKDMKGLARHGNDILFIGDPAQSMLSGVSNAPYIKSLFYDEQSKESRVDEVSWLWSHRCPKSVVTAASGLLDARKNIVQDKNATSISSPGTAQSDEHIGGLYFYSKQGAIDNYAATLQGKDADANRVVIVPNAGFIEEAKELFHTPFIVTPQEFLGMGAREVVMYRCFEEDVPDALSSGDKSVSLQEPEKIAVNELFVAMTRAEENLIICEKNKLHKNRGLFDKMGLEDLHKQTIAAKDSGPKKADVKSVSDKAASDKEWEDRIIKMIKSNNFVGAKRICDDRFADNADEMFDILHNRAINPSGKAKASAEKEEKKPDESLKKPDSDEKVGAVSEASSEQSASASVKKKSKKKKSKKKAADSESKESDALPVAEKLSELVTVINNADSDKFSNLIKEIPVQDLIKHRTSVGNLLHAAVISNNKRQVPHDLAEILIDHVAGQESVTEFVKTMWFNQTNDQGKAPVHYAAQLGCDKMIDALGKTGLKIDFDIEDAKGLRPIYLAAKKDDGNVISALQKHGADIDVQNKARKSMIEIAARKGSSEIVRTLKEHGANINVTYEDGSPFIYYAVAEGNLDIVKILVENGADIESGETIDGRPMSSIYPAVLQGHHDIINFLVESGADINTRSSDGHTPIHYAAKNGDEKTVELLISRGADVDLAAIDGSTPLYAAVRNNYDQVVEKLAPVVKDIDAVTESETAFVCAARNDYIKILQLLLDNGANPSYEVVEGVTPLYLAALNGNSKVIDLLVESGCKDDIHRSDGENRSPIYMASCQGHDKTVETLIRHGADVHVVGNEGITPLYVASLHGYDKTVETLLKHGVDANVVDDQGMSPLFIAALNEHQETVKSLLDNGACIHKKYSTSVYDGGVTTAKLSFAEPQGGHKVIESLIPFAANQGENSAVNHIANAIMKKVSQKNKRKNLKETTMLALMDYCEGDQESLLQMMGIKSEDINQSKVVANNPIIRSIANALSGVRKDEKIAQAYWAVDEVMIDKALEVEEPSEGLRLSSAVKMDSVENIHKR